MQKYLITLSLLLSAGLATGQGWQRLYGGGGADAANAISKTADGGYILAGAYGNDRVLMVKVDADGHEQWIKNYTDFPAPVIQANAVVATKDSGYVVAGYRNINNHRNIFLLKTDAYGNRLWARNFGNVDINFDEEAYSLVELADGSLAMTGYQMHLNAIPENNVAILKTDKDGNQLWFRTYPTLFETKGRSLTTAANGDLMVAGEISDTSVTKKAVYVLRLNPTTGDTIWTQRYNPFGVTVDEMAHCIVATSNDEFVMGGFSTVGGFLLKISGTGNPAPLWQVNLPNQITIYSVALTANGDIYAAGNDDATDFGNMYIRKIHADGALVWEKSVGRAAIDVGSGVVAAKDGGATAVGYSESFLLGDTRAYMVKTDPNGLVFTSVLHGNIFWDQNANCLPDNGEVSLSNWIVGAANQYYDTTYAVTNASGDFRIDVDTGIYTVSLFRPNSYWESCTPTTDVYIATFADTFDVSVPVRSLFNCPRNEVDVATPILRRCADNVYTVRYCNSGTIASTNTTIQVIVDPFLTIVGSSIPYTQQQDTLLFNVSDLADGDCESFTFTAFLDCDNTVTKQTHCVSAHIYPDGFCDLGLWDQSYLEARAQCDGDSVRMYLTNKGIGDMANFTQFIITEDVILLTAPDDPNYRIQLPAGKDSLVWSHPANGKTFRIIGEQTPNYPGISYPSAAIEGCLNPDSTGTPISYGFYTMFPEDDADAFVSVHCQESEDSSYNPTYLKRGHPKGYDDPHYVSPKTDLDFLIQFQNDGTDTVQQVIIRDTLAAELDPTTVYPGAASHPYEFQVYGNGIVEFFIPNTNLVPDSSASEGYVKFRVSQKPNLPCGTVILNSAAIYFDFNAPVTSNQTFHTVCDTLVLILDTKVIYIPGADLRVYPNPFEESTQFEVSGVNAKSYALALYDIQGRLLSNTFYSHSNFRLYRHQIPAGVFFYRLTADGKPVATGKLIAK